MTQVLARKKFGLDERLKGALLQHKALSLEGMSERLFGLLFSGLVYPQIWEDPEVDLMAMELRPEHRIATIASGGCNMLSYLARGPASIDVADLNASHIALNRLKIAAFAHLPTHPDVMRFFGIANEPSNVIAYRTFIAAHLDDETRRYWEGRRLNGKRRIDVFNGNFYRTGLLGRFIGASHIAARLCGVDLTEIMAARTLEEQREFFERRIAPIFDRKVVRWITARKSSLFGLGIPPRQFDELASLTDEKTLAGVLRQRVEKLACQFPAQRELFRLAGLRPPLPHSRGRQAAALPQSRQLPADQGEPRSRDAAPRQFRGDARHEASRIDGPLRAARRTGLDDRRADQQSLARDHPHRARRCPRDLPDCRREKRRCRQARARDRSPLDLPCR